MAVKILITVEGSEQVKQAVDEVRKNFEGLASTVNELGKDSAGQSAFKDFAVDVGKPAESIKDTTNAAHDLHRVLQVLHPILRAAGIEMNAFAGFSRLASVSIGGVGAAITGAILVGLAKLEENAARTKGALDDLFGKPGEGSRAFEALQTQAKQFGTTVGGLAPGLEAFQTALNNVNREAKGFVALKAEDLPGAAFARDADKVTTAYGNFVKLLRAGRQTQDDAEKSAKAFFDAFKDGGNITSAAIRNLPIGTIDQLKQALGGAGQTTRAFFEMLDAGQISVDKFRDALIAFSPQAQKAFDTKAIKTLSDEFHKLLASLQKETPTGAGTAGVSSFLQSLLSTVTATGEAINDVLAKAVEGMQSAVAKIRLASGTFVGPTLEQAGLGAAAGALAPFPTPEQAGKMGTDAGSSFNEGFLKAGFVFPPSAAAQAGSTIGKAISENPFFKDELPQDVSQPISDGIKQGLETLATEETQAAIVEKFAQSGQDAGQAFNTGMQSEAQATKESFQSLYDQIRAMFSVPIPVSWDTSNSFLSGQPTNLATGGLVKGPGTSTSDSIFARLSNREYVLNARAVSFYGADLLHALNAMRIPRDYFQGFNMGGMVRAMVSSLPGFAQGGQVQNAGTPITLVIDNQKFSMTGSADTVKALSRFAVHRQICSTGRKPSFVK